VADSRVARFAAVNRQRSKGFTPREGKAATGWKAVGARVGIVLHRGRGADRRRAVTPELRWPLDYVCYGPRPWHAFRHRQNPGKILYAGSKNCLTGNVSLFFLSKVQAFVI
jgi:hypothetical protein